MSFNGSGVFQINSTGQPVVAGTVISSTAFNALTADLATGLSTCVTKDGQTTPTANLPMASYKFTGLGAGTDAGDSANLSQVQSTVVKLIGSISGVDTITGSLTPALTAYAAGQMFYFVAAGANTSAVTLNVNSLGAKAVTRDGSTALVAGDIASGEVVVVIYDGTRFQMISPNTFGDITFSTNTISTAGTNQNMILSPNGTGTVTITTSSALISSNLRINSSGTLITSEQLTVTSQTSGLAAAFKQENGSSDAVTAYWNNGTSGDNAFTTFATEAAYTVRGTITYNRGAGQVAYNTTSDRRAKTITGLVTNSGQIVDSLNVYSGKMNWGTIEYPMMIADEAMQITPYCVTGEPNAVNADGSPKYQQMDYSALVPLLLAEIQSLRARVAILEEE
jgi:hypothetical protein